MPAFYDMPSVFGNANVEDTARFLQTPFFTVKNEVKKFPIWNTFDQLYGKIDWVTNQGNIMKGVTPQRSPVGRSFFFPNAVTQVANKDIYQVTQSVEQAVVTFISMNRFNSTSSLRSTSFGKTTCSSPIVTLLKRLLLVTINSSKQTCGLTRVMPIFVALV